MQTPEEIESYRDKIWRREETLKVSKPTEAEAFIEEAGFSLALTDVRTVMPSLYVAVCGRRDVFAPKNVQKDPEVSSAWTLKDDLMRRGNVYYSKLAKGRATFIARDMIESAHAIYRVSPEEESEKLSPAAQMILEVLREEWESSTADLKAETGIAERKTLTKAIEDLQRCMKVIPYEVLYEPKFTYLWTLAEERFPKELSGKLSREEGIYNIAKRFLKTFGFTQRAELSKAFGLGRAEAGAANHRLVEEGYAERLATGVYRLKSLAP